MSQDIQTLLPELKRLASMATPGEWVFSRDSWNVTTPGVERDISVYIPEDEADMTGEFIAAANPSTLLTLVAHIEALERQLADLRQAERQEVCCGNLGPHNGPKGPQRMCCGETLEAERQAPEGVVQVPIKAYLWLMGLGNDGFTEDRNGAFWWRGAFNERAGLDMVGIYEASRVAPSAGQAKPQNDGRSQR